MSTTTHPRFENKGQGVGHRARRFAAAAVIGTALSLALASPVVAAVPSENITLPNDAVAGDVGFQPEGVAIRKNTAYVGSFADGTVVSVNLRSGETDPLVRPDAEPALGVEAVGSLLLVAGASSGELRVYERGSGEEVAVYDVTDSGLVNDITVAGGTAYFTDSQRAVLYALPTNGRTVGEPREIPLGGDFELAQPGPFVFNSNGIAALDASTLVVAQTNDPDGEGSALYAVDAASGDTTRITIEGGDVRGADGLVLRGRTLYVVQFDSNSIAQLRLSGDGTTAEYVRTIADEDLNVPTTADFGPRGDLYAVNSRFFTPPSDSVLYELVRIDR